VSITAERTTCDAATVAQELDCAVETVYRYAAIGKIPHYRMGRIIRFNLPAVLDALEQPVGQPVSALPVVAEASPATPSGRARSAAQVSDTPGPDDGSARPHHAAAASEGASTCALPGSEAPRSSSDDADEEGTS
jgi:excisionase family DNA binding protein